MASNHQTPNPQTQQQSQPSPNHNPLALPSTFSPDSLDALTSLSAELVRVRAHLVAATSDDLAPPPPPSSSAAAADQQQLSVKDFVGPSDAIKHKIQRARRAMAELPDVKRTRAQQEREAEELRGRMERQREALRALRALGEGMAKSEGDKMEM